MNETESKSHHISVCVCTYKRPCLLKRLLEGLGAQETEGKFTYSIVIADNDHLESGRAVAQEFAAASSIPVKYCVQPHQNIALTRNKAIENSSGDYVAFIDDDEFTTNRWLLTLFNARGQYQVDGVLGPVRPHFDQEPPRWVIKGKFYERQTYPTGFVIDGKMGRTGNVLLKKSLFVTGDQPFRPEFRTGEDQDFFGRMIAKGHIFVWCNEAVAFEVVPPTRWKLSFMLRRALLRGASSLAQRASGGVDIAKSFVAVAAYTAVLPFSIFLGQGRFMLCLVKLFDHMGKVLAVVGINPVKEPYVTE